MESVITEFNNIFKSIEDKYYINGRLNKTKVINDLENFDEVLIGNILQNEILQKHFTEEISGHLVVDINKIIKILEMNNFWQDSLTQYENKIGLTVNGKYLDEQTDVVLDFPYKDTILKAGMTKEDINKGELKPDESFLNELVEAEEIDQLLDKKILVNAKRYSSRGVEENVELSRKDNLILKGNNLIVLTSLLEQYEGKVKCIYIDPPYNTGSDSFLYNDNFNRSTWLTFMKNRIEIAKQLLRKDGVILVSIDEKQQAYLKVLMDEMFGAENLLDIFHIQVRYTNKSLNEKDDFQPVMEYVLAYAIDKKVFKPNKPYKAYSLNKFEWEINELAQGEEIELGGKKVTIFKDGEYEINKVKSNIDGLKETWASGSVLTGNTSGKFFDQYISKRKKIDGLKVLYKVEGIGEDGIGYRYFTGPQKETSIRGKFYSGVPLKKRKEIETGESRKYYPIVNYYDYSGSFGNIRHEGGVSFNSGKKPERLLKMLFDFSTNEGDLILDYHIGSGSSSAVAHKMNRQYIGVEQMDYIKEKSVQRLRSVIDGDTTGISEDVDWQGGGSFVYAELMEKSRGYIDQVMNADNSDKLMSIYETMLEYVDLEFRADLDAVKEMVEDISVSIKDKQRMLIKIIDKNQLYYNYSEIDDKNVRDLISDSDYAFNQSFYSEGNG